MSQQNFSHAGEPPSMIPSPITNWIQTSVSWARRSLVTLNGINFSFADPLTPLSVEMLAGEDLPHLLQTLLVGVEHAICRIPLDDLTFPPSSATVSSCSRHNVIEFATDYSMDEKNAASKRAECNLKRRELITKNNSINKKYAIKRTTCNGSSSLTTSESETLDEARELTASTNPSSDVVLLTNETDSLTSTGAVASTLPLFCLGGSFPHIDSDEESGDDAKRTQSGELFEKKSFFAELWRCLKWKRFEIAQTKSISNVLKSFMTGSLNCFIFLWCWPPKVYVFADRSAAMFKLFKIRSSDKHKNDFLCSALQKFIGIAFFSSVPLSSTLLRRRINCQQVKKQLFMLRINLGQTNRLPTRFSTFGIDLWYALTLNYTLGERSRWQRENIINYLADAS